METLAFEGTIEQEKELKAVFKKYKQLFYSVRAVSVFSARGS